MGPEHVVTFVLEKRTLKNGQVSGTVLYSGMPDTSDPGPLAPGPTVGCCLEGIHTK
jgi:hypothetical protein